MKLTRRFLLVTACIGGGILSSIDPASALCVGDCGGKGGKVLPKDQHVAAGKVDFYVFADIATPKTSWDIYFTIDGAEKKAKEWKAGDYRYALVPSNATYIREEDGFMDFFCNASLNGRCLGGKNKWKVRSNEITFRASVGRIYSNIP